MRSRFDEQLALLNRELIEMGALCEEVIALASKALTEQDTALARRVAPLDTEIDQKERTIESMCLKLLFAAAACGARPAPNIGGAENDNGYGAHRRSGGGYRRDRHLPRRAHRRERRPSARDGEGRDKNGNGERGRLRPARHGARGKGHCRRRHRRQVF